MYAKHFQLAELPFSIALNPRYLYLSQQHQEALAHLLYGIGAGGGFVVLTGEVGTGKTTLCRALLDQLPEDVDIALIFNPRLSSKELISAICDELHIDYPKTKTSLKNLIDALNHHLLEAHSKGRRVIVLIDEAQNLRFDVLEQIRLLTNLETDQTKLIQIILVGQPELSQILARPNLRQLAQRITARYHLNPLNHEETSAYIAHRMTVAGGSGQVFTKMAINAIFHHSRGIPRLINLISDRALLGAYAKCTNQVNGLLSWKASRELIRTRPTARSIVLLSGLVCAGLLLGWHAFSNQYSDRSNLFATSTAWFRGSIPPALPIETTDKKTLSLERRTPESNHDSTMDETLSDTSKSTTVETSPTPVGINSSQEWLSDGHRNKEKALTFLASLWNLVLPENDEVCTAAPTQGVRCLSIQASWNQLVNLNHPAVLELSREGQQFVTLIHFRQNEAILADFRGERIVKLDDLLPLWSGRATILWRSSLPKQFKSIELGMTSPVISWIRTRLNEPAEGDTQNVYDARLEARIMDIQKSRGIKPDGVIGVNTLIVMEALGEKPDVPVLETIGIK